MSHATQGESALAVPVSLIAALLAGTAPALAADFPSRPVHIVVPYGTGGGTDRGYVTAGSGTNPAGECLVFGSGYTWGAVRSADVKLAGEVASSLPVQIIADPSVPATPPTATGTVLVSGTRAPVAQV